MSFKKTDDEQLLRLNKFQVWIGLGVGLATIITAISSYIIIPYRLNAAESEIVGLKASRSADHELLIRIDERLNQLPNLLDKKIQDNKPSKP